MSSQSGSSLNASDLMRSPVISAPSDLTVADAARKMLEHKVGCLVVVGDDGKYEGIVTEQSFLPREESFSWMRGTLVRVMGVNAGADGDVNYGEKVDHLCSLLVSDVMYRDVPTADPDSSVDAVVKMIVDHECQHVAVLEDDVAVGIISRHDVLRLFVD